MSGPAVIEQDPLAAYTPNWRGRAQRTQRASSAAPASDPLAGYRPNWRTGGVEVKSTDSVATVAMPGARRTPQDIARLADNVRAGAARVPGVQTDAARGGAPVLETYIPFLHAGGGTSEDYLYAPGNEPSRTARPPAALAVPVDVATGLYNTVRHPIETGKAIAEATVGAAYRSSPFGPAVEGTVVTPSRYLRGKSGPVPGSLRPGTVITRENTPSAITPHEFYTAAGQTVANAAAAPFGAGVASVADRTFGGLAGRALAERGIVDAGEATAAREGVRRGAQRLGRMAGAGLIGAANDPEHPLRGAATLAVLGEVLHPLGTAAGRAATPVVDRLQRGVRDVAVEVGTRARAARAERAGRRAGLTNTAERSAPHPASTPAPAPELPAAPTPRTPPVPAEPPTLRRRVAESIDPTISQQIREAEANPVTGLPGRAPFNRALGTAEADPHTAVVRFDVNGTKSINDALGHPFTDEHVLQGAASALTRAAADVGVPERVFHLSGDEFAAIVPADKAEPFRQRAQELYGVREHGPGLKSSLSGGVGATEVDADAAAYRQKAADKAAQGIVGREGSTTVRTVPLSDIDVEPERFQFKHDMNAETGAGKELKGVTTFNPDLAGVVSVWRDPADGRLKIVNGHHRYELAKRTGQPTLDVREIHAPTAEAARAKGALINIAEGRGTPLDAAKLIRDTGFTADELGRAGVSMRGALASKGFALSHLDPTLFDRVARGEVPEEIGVAVGKVLDSPEQQRAAVELIRRSGKRLTSAEAENVARQVRDAGSESIRQESLFGTEETALSLAVDRARLAESLKKDLTRDKRLFGFVSKAGRAEELQRGGNVINAEESARLAESSAHAAEVFDRLASRAGPISDLLTEGARRLARGETLAAVKGDIDSRLRAAVSDALAGRETGRPGAGGGYVSAGATPAEHGRGPAAAEEAVGGTGGADAERGIVTDADRAVATALRGVPVANPTGRQAVVLGDDGRYYTGATHGIAAVNAEEAGARVVDANLFQMADGRIVTRAEAAQPATPLASRAGPISDILTDGARRLARGETIAAVKADITPRLREAVQAALEGGEGAGTGRSGGAVSRGPSETGVASGTAEAEDAVGGTGARFFDETGAPLADPMNLFGEEEPSTAPAQESLFGATEGTAASRTLSQTETAARSELPVLRERLRLETDPTRRASLAGRIAKLERLVNRGEKIGAEELGTRAAAQEPSEPSEPGQGALFARTAPASEPLRNPRFFDENGNEVSSLPSPSDEEAAGVAAAGKAVPPGRGEPIAPMPKSVLDDVQRVLAPPTRTPESRMASRIIRARAGEFAHEMERAHEGLKAMGRRFNTMTRASRLDFIDRLEHGRRQPTRELDEAARLLRRALDDARDEVRRLGTGKLEQFIEHYFPHIWEEPGRVQRTLRKLMRRGPLEGPKSFLKQRSIPTTREGIEAGLVPVTTNPVDLTLLKLREMRRYVMAQRILQEMKGRGLVRFVSATDRAPEGYRRIDDRIATVYGKPTVEMLEVYDKAVKEQLDAILDRLGVTHTRKLRIGKGSPGEGVTLGFANAEGITTRAGTPHDVLIHELGHVLDRKYGLWDRLTKGGPKGPGSTDPTVREELNALADLRVEGMTNVPAEHRAYIRNRFEQMAVSLQALLYAPERMAEVAPTVKARLEAFLASTPELAPLLDVKPSLVHGVETHEIPVGGLVIRGHYYAPEPVTTVLNNYLSPGLSGNAIYDAYRGLGNVLNQAQLGLSAFHLGFTSMDAAVSKAALGIEQLAAGHPLQALGSFARTPIAPIENYLRGSRVLKAYLWPGTQGSEMAAVVDALVQGGGRVRMDSFYKNSSVERFLTALHERRPVRAGLLTLPAALEAAAKPIFEVIVPRQKLGVFADLARLELSRLPRTASPDLVREAMARAWDSVDNRMGQLVYDNLFWHRTLKDLAFASVRSVGWNLGTLRELGGGARDAAAMARDVAAGRPVRLSHRTAYVVALPMVVGITGAMLQYLMTGQGPQSLTDYFYPRTGQRSADGTDERIELPTYAKDVLAATRHPVQTVANKLHPLLGAITEMMQNEDFYGDMIRNPDDPLVQQLHQEAGYLADQFVPFGIQNFQQTIERGEPATSGLPSFVGVTPAPREVVRTDAQNRIIDYLARRGHGHATPEDREASQTRRTLARHLRAHAPGAAQAVVEALRAGDLTRQQAQTMLRSRQSDPWVDRFKMLTVDEALDVYERATAEEQRAWRIPLLKKIRNARKNGQRVRVPASARRVPVASGR